MPPDNSPEQQAPFVDLEAAKLAIDSFGGDAGEFQLGPHFAGLQVHKERMAVLRGVRTESLNHPAAAQTSYARA